MRELERTSDPIAELLREGSSLSPANERASREAFLGRVDVEMARPRGVSRMVWAAPLAVAAALLLTWVFWPVETLSYEVAGAARDGNYIRAEGDSARVRFSDATEVTAAPGTRLRVVETRTSGAQVSVESGSLSVRVTHTGSSEWNFAAGPFDVHVTGTRFDLAWDALTERLSVELHEGSVEIDGYDASGPVSVRAGQRFVGDARARTMQVSEAGPAVADSGGARPSSEQGQALRAEVDIERARQDSAVEAPPGSEPNSQPRATAAERARAETSWTALVSKGKFQDVVSAAHARGVEACLSACSASELGALADAARYTGQADLASRSLNAMRDRFSGSTKVRAAFLLGRLSEGQGQLQSAKKWYETALIEAPGGDFAGESLAGKMRTVLGLQGRTAAHPIAQEYLRRYPEGVHSGAARKITEP